MMRTPAEFEDGVAAKVRGDWFFLGQNSAVDITAAVRDII